MSCPACGGALAPWRSVPGGEPTDARSYELLRCTVCGTGVTEGEAPTAEAYESGQYAPGEPRAAALLARVQRLATKQEVGFLRRAGLASGARVVDVGAGRGRLVGALQAAGFDARGIEPSLRSVELARAAGVELEQRAVFEHSDVGLDAVVMWHVLEHLGDPVGALARVRDWLRPGGLLLVGTPNAGSLQAHIGDEGWLHWDAPRHRVHFTVDGLTRALRRARFEPVAVHHWVVDQNLHSMWMALLVRLGMRPGFPFHFLKRNIDARPRDLALSAVGVPLLPVAVALEAGAAAARRGGTVAVVARAG